MSPLYAELVGLAAGLALIAAVLVAVAVRARRRRRSADWWVVRSHDLRTGAARAVPCRGKGRALRLYGRLCAANPDPVHIRISYQRLGGMP